MVKQIFFWDGKVYYIFLEVEDDFLLDGYTEKGFVSKWICFFKLIFGQVEEEILMDEGIVLWYFSVSE